MSTWRRLAVELFPEHRQGLFAFQQNDTSIYMVLSDLLEDAKRYHRIGDAEQLKPIYQFAEWCFAQEKRAPDVYNAVLTAFYEHLADEDVTAEAIPFWIRPMVFEVMFDEFRWRRERSGEGKFQKLLEEYDRVNGTTFLALQVK